MSFHPHEFVDSLNLVFDDVNYAKVPELELFSKSDFLEVPELKYSAPITEASPVVESSSTASNDATIDKKRRNTAASARFRVKKKLKEQQMMVKHKQLQDTVYGLEQKVMQLEMENKCLKKLVMEKNTQGDDVLNIIKKRSLDPKPFFEYTK